MSRPQAKFRNYAEYRSSEFYSAPEHVRVHPPYRFSERIYESNCPVWLYEEEESFEWFFISNYESCKPVTVFCDENDEDDFSPDAMKRYELEQEVSQQFSLPFIYYSGQWGFFKEETLHKFLASQLMPGDTAERYDCWACEESQPRDVKYDISVSLQSFVENGVITYQNSEYYEQTSKRFIKYSAPKRTIELDWVSDCDVITVFRKEGLETILYEIGAEFGVHM